ncbi:MAG: putative DNA binding domain-containing protein [Betaproteobacteria bacterium]|nr:putative DNA binding domain-containing protein [Betaproteobacteria bacterium]
MALPINIESLLHGKAVEWERLEFKAGWDPLAVLHTICAFANDFHNLGGGYIIVGVAERQGQPRLPPIGLKRGQIDAIQKEILNLGHNAIQPYYHPVVVPATINGRHILVIWVLGGQTRPYKARLSFAKGGKEYAYFIRKGSSTVRARGADETELLSLAATVPFDDRINQRAKVKDLSRELMTDYLQRVGSDLAKQARKLPLLKLGRQMGVIGGAAEAPFPLNVGLMMFNPEPWRFFPAMQIDVVWFPKEGPGGNKFSEKIFKGPIPRMTRDALDYIKRNLITETVIKHRDRAEATRVENFPYAAIEEAVVNAVYHRGYDVREPVEIRLEHSELTVISYPGPDRSVRLELLRIGRAQPRRYRNRRIGEFLKELEFTEGRCTGIPKIIEAMRKNSSPPAEFEFDEDYSYFMVRLPVHPTALEVAESQAGVESTQSPTQSPTQSSDPVERLLILLKQGEQSSGDLRMALGIRHRPNFRENYLHPALAQGLIEYTLPDKPSSRLQQYRLTDKGRARLANLESAKP